MTVIASTIANSQFGPSNILTVPRRSHVKAVSIDGVASQGFSLGVATGILRIKQTHGDKTL